jgi:deoxyribodipyrimidine photolyase
MSTAIVWLRRDLRVHDHPPLVAALAAHARVIPAFVLDPVLLSGRFASAPRTAFMLDCLRELDRTLRERGGGLVIRRGAAERDLLALAREVEAWAVYWASDATPYALARDRRVRAALQAAGVEAVPGPGNFVADIGRPRTRAGKPFTVFTPFHRVWSALERRTVHRAPRRLPPLPRGLDRGAIPTLEQLGLNAADLLPEPAAAPGEVAARAALARWLARDLDAYSDRHDRLAGGTSTGYPLVDAGMRQLRASGWMHNRARLVVGSFLTKDLQLDWRAGEAWFMRWLLDGDVAQNNGNWQWIASVGVDPAPAFRRLLNPALQQRRHDPDGAYVRRWVPELRGVRDERLAEPWRMSAEEQAASGCTIGRDYPAPVVDHAQERRRALARYRAAVVSDGA